MKFFEMTEDERREWRQDPVTRAFLEWLDEHWRAKRKDVVDAAQSAEVDLGDVRYAAGMYKGIDDVRYAIQK